MYFLCASCTKCIIRRIANYFNVSSPNPDNGWLVYDVQRHFQQYFSYIVAVSFIGGGNQSTQRKPPTCHKSLTNFITLCSIKHTLPCAHFFEITALVVIAHDCTSNCKFKHHLSTTAPRNDVMCCYKLKILLKVELSTTTITLKCIK